jgi:hypothetical protein
VAFRTSKIDSAWNQHGCLHERPQAKACATKPLYMPRHAEVALSAMPTSYNEIAGQSIERLAAIWTPILKKCF